MTECNFGKFSKKKKNCVKKILIFKKLAKLHSEFLQGPDLIG